MSKDFDYIGHKNIELLRFYINKDLTKIDKKLSTSSDNFLGYFLASLVDILIVFVFNDYLECVSILRRIILIIGLLVLFLLVSKIVIGFMKWRTQSKKQLGKDRYLTEEIQQVIDDFDNIACDGLLICENYCQRYEDTAKVYLQDFYLYEIIHHLDKALNICEEICSEQNLYASSEHDDLIDLYRIKNFVQFASEIYDFLMKRLENKSLEYGLQKSVYHLAITLDKLKSHLS